MQASDWLWFRLFSATFSNISVISQVSFIGGGNRRKPPTWHKTLTNFRVHLAMSAIQTLNVSDDAQWLYLLIDKTFSKSNYHTVTTTTVPLNDWKRTESCIVGVAIDMLETSTLTIVTPSRQDETCFCYSNFGNSGPNMLLLFFVLSFFLFRMTIFSQAMYPSLQIVS